MPRHSRPMNASLFIRNCPPDARSEEIREIFSKHGPVTDVYIPLDYYTRQHRGFAYVQFEDARDADDALYYLNGFRYCGVELEVEVARSDRKTPYMMRSRERGGRYDDYDDYDYNRGRGGRDRRRSYSRSPRWRGRRSRSRSRSASGRRDARRHHSPQRRERSSSMSSRGHRN